MPTGLGKTSVMALWLIALAAGADVPRRLVYVVDRRAVVDQATRFATRLRENMGGELGRSLGLGDRRLPISTLRGGFADNRDWLEDPSVPAIVVGTVDMVGSRLLFEGYGVSSGMRPYHAGFLGVDTLLVLDEAHLCHPFEALLRDIAAHRDTKFGADASGPEVAPAAGFRLMSLSATSRAVPGAFRLEDEDREEPLVRERLVARKRVQLTDIDDPKNLSAELAKRAVALGFGAPGERTAPARVVVYCDRRQDAVKVKSLVDRQIKARTKSASGGLGGVSELLVGERRIYERSRLEEWLEANSFLASNTSSMRDPRHQPAPHATDAGRDLISSCSPAAPAFLVATSAGEVGVDLDADHMVCDLVAYERMAQRLGRVNRRGGDGRSAMVDVVAVRPVLRSAPSKTQRAKHDVLLAKLDAQSAVLTTLPVGADGRHDGSPDALTGLRVANADIVERATTPAPLHPELTRPCLESWAMTSLKEHAGRPEVAPWLRGWEDDEGPSADVVWRAWLPCRRIGDEVSAPNSLVESFFQIAPIHVTERLAAARDHVLDWLYKRVHEVQKRGNDHDLALRGDEVVALVLDRAGRLVRSASLAELAYLGERPSRLDKAESEKQHRDKDEWSRHLAGATLVVTSRFGGLTDGMLDPNHDGEARAADADEAWFGLREEEGSGRPVIKFRVQRLVSDIEADGLERDALDGWAHLRTFETDFNVSGGVEGGLAVYKWPDEAGEDVARSVSTKPQTLRDHAEQVATCVREVAARLGLSPAATDALERAALWHDHGKDTPRWQNAMNAPRDGRPYAKTGGGGNWRLLEGYRHEFGSLLAAERTCLPTETRDLILHLIAAHHGNARPVISPDGCDDGPPSLLETKAGEAARRYARLQRQYGIWGLAWLEAILRAADQRASREWAASGGACAKERV